MAAEVRNWKVDSRCTGCSNAADEASLAAEAQKCLTRAVNKSFVIAIKTDEGNEHKTRYMESKCFISKSRSICTVYHQFVVVYP